MHTVMMLQPTSRRSVSPNAGLPAWVRLARIAVEIDGLSANLGNVEPDELAISLVHFALAVEDLYETLAGKWARQHTLETAA